MAVAVACAVTLAVTLCIWLCVCVCDVMCVSHIRGGQESMDVSADLTEMGRTPVAVVCAGAKSVSEWSAVWGAGQGSVECNSRRQTRTELLEIWDMHRGKIRDQQRFDVRLHQPRRILRLQL